MSLSWWKLHPRFLFFVHVVKSLKKLSFSSFRTSSSRWHPVGTSSREDSDGAQSYFHMALHQYKEHWVHEGLHPISLLHAHQVFTRVHYLENYHRVQSNQLSGYCNFYLKVGKLCEYFSSQTNLSLTLFLFVIWCMITKGYIESSQNLIYNR